MTDTRITCGIICAECGKSFQPSRDGKKRFCSKACAGRESGRIRTLKKRAIAEKRLQRCKTCGVYFVPRRANTHTNCSDRCRLKPISLICVACGASFMGRKKMKYCSRDCANLLVNGSRKATRIKKKCINCGKLFELKPYQVEAGRTCCNRKCSTENQIKRGIGREFVRLINGCLERIVKIDSRVYRRKSVQVLESPPPFGLGRKLTPSERMRIEFLDGNHLNCYPQNLRIRDLKTCVYTCDLCGKIRLHRNSNARLPRFCMDCVGLYRRDNPMFCGENTGRSKLTEDDVREIRRLYHYGDGPIFAQKYGVSRSTITYIIKRRIWKHVL